MGNGGRESKHGFTQFESDGTEQKCRVQNACSIGMSGREQIIKDLSDQITVCSF